MRLELGLLLSVLQHLTVYCFPNIREEEGMFISRRNKLNQIPKDVVLAISEMLRCEMTLLWKCQQSYYMKHKLQDEAGIG